MKAIKFASMAVPQSKRMSCPKAENSYPTVNCHIFPGSYEPSILIHQCSTWTTNYFTLKVIVHFQEASVFNQAQSYQSLDNKQVINFTHVYKPYTNYE